MRTLGVVFFALATLTLAACSGHTTPADEVTTTSATLNGAGFCEAGDEGRIYWEYAPVGTEDWTRVYGVNGGDGRVLPQAGSTTETDPCTSRIPASGEVAFEKTVTGLLPVRAYKYRVGFHFVNDAQVTADGSGPSGTNYQTFTTAAGCTRTVAAGTSFPTATLGLGAGATLCLSAGTYNWGEVAPAAGLTIRGLGGVTVVGGFELNDTRDNVTLDNFKVNATAAVGEATILVEGDNFTARRLELNNNFVPGIQGFIIGNATHQTNGTKILDTEIHSVRGSGACGVDPGGHQFFHAIYWANGINGEVARVWMYDIAGFGLHFYSNAGGSAAGTQVHHTVTDDTLCPNLGNVFNDISGPTTFNRTIITDAGPWDCVVGGVTVSNSRSQNGFNGCSGSGNVTADTGYQSEASRDYRVPGNPEYQFIPGPS